MTIIYIAFTNKECESVYQEFDILFTDGKKLFIIECKAINPKNLSSDYIHKLEFLTQEYGGINSTGILACTVKLDEQTVDDELLKTRKLAKEHKFLSAKHAYLIADNDLEDEFKSITGFDISENIDLRVNAKKESLIHVKNLIVSAIWIKDNKKVAIFTDYESIAIQVILEKDELYNNCVVGTVLKFKLKYDTESSQYIIEDKSISKKASYKFKKSLYNKTVVVDRIFEKMKFLRYQDCEGFTGTISLTRIDFDLTEGTALDLRYFEYKDIYSNENKVSLVEINKKFEVPKKLLKEYKNNHHLDVN